MRITRAQPTLATIFGSVSAQLVAHAQCPVLVIPASVGYDPGGPLGLATASV